MDNTQLTSDDSDTMINISLDHDSGQVYIHATKAFDLLKLEDKSKLIAIVNSVLGQKLGKVPFLFSAYDESAANISVSITEKFETLAIPQKVSLLRGLSGVVQSLIEQYERVVFH